MRMEDRLTCLLMWDWDGEVTIMLGGRLWDIDGGKKLQAKEPSAQLKLSF